METVTPENCLQFGAGVKVLGKTGKKETTNSSGAAVKEFERVGMCDFSIKHTSVKYYCGVTFP